MELVITFALVVATAVIGFLVGRNSAPDQKKVTDMESIILEKDAELQSYQKKVTEHFDNTAQLFGKVTDSYQTLYQHMANSSQDLVGSQPFKPAIENNTAQNSSEQPAQVQAPQNHLPKIDEEPISLEDTFNNESLYKAHEYRNQTESQSTSETAPENIAHSMDTADIIQLEQAKTELDEKTKKSGAVDNSAALDYAIKEEGVVNHNSLDIEPKKS